MEAKVLNGVILGGKIPKLHDTDHLGHISPGILSLNDVHHLGHSMGAQVILSLDISDSTVDFHSSALSQSMSVIFSLAGKQVKDLKGLETWKSPIVQDSSCRCGLC